MEYVLLRKFVLLSRVPPNEDSATAPTDAELDQMASDVFELQDTALTARWRRTRTLARQRRDARRQQREEEDDDDDDDSDYSDDSDDDSQLDLDDDAAETAWRQQKVQEIRRNVRALTASQQAAEEQLQELDYQEQALDVVGRA